MKAKELRGRTESALAASREALERLLHLPAGAPATEVLHSFDAVRLPLNGVRGWVHLFSAVHPEGAVRSLADDLEREVERFDTELSLDRSVYERLAGIDATGLDDPLDRRLLEHALRDYRRSGVDRDEETRERIRALSDELVEIGQTFNRNILSDTRSIRIEEGRAGLAGLPADYVAAHEEDPGGAVTVTTDPPDLLPFMTYAERDDLRERLMREFLDRAWPVNGAVLADLFAKRRELAGLLGYETWADYATETRMIESPARAREFIERVVAIARPTAEAEVQELCGELLRSRPEATRVQDWQRQFLVERVKRSRFGFDSQDVRPYFAYERVKQGALDVSARLYGVELRRVEGADVWHPSVECYEIVTGGEVTARFYLDMHPRPGKYKHAMMSGIVDGVHGAALPEACLVCNFPEPRAGAPGLMQHTQVTTFFHELGHLLHHLFAGEGRYLKFSGISMEWDFVEVPSQLFEEWAWDPGLLAGFARHHETGEPIPAELVARMRRADEYGKGLHALIQMSYALYSLRCYTEDPAGFDPFDMWREVKESVTPLAFAEGTHFPAAFGHLNGYSAAYYTYMWSLVIAKDMFSRFEGALMDAETARSYREQVLAQGGSEDAARMVEAFLGREFEFDAFERWLVKG